MMSLIIDNEINKSAYFLHFIFIAVKCNALRLDQVSTNVHGVYKMIK